MSNDTTLRPKFGTYTVTDEELAGINAIWGARLIAPADLLWDRQDLRHDDVLAKDDLVTWLNTDAEGVRGKGALSKAQDFLHENYHTMPQDETRVTLYEDEHGIIVGSTQGSYGYVYVCGWRK